jgi:pyridoxamine 5'-phosphate oxidase family protein
MTVPQAFRDGFTDRETKYIKSQKLARLATSSNGSSQPDVAPVGYDFDGEYFYVSGINVERTLKYKNVRRNPRVSLVIDDLVSTDPWHVRGVKIHGSADIVEKEGYIGAAEYIRIKPEKKWSWGIDDS